MRLCVDLHESSFGVLGNLTSLQELELGSLAGDNCPNFIIDLHKLTDLRMLDVNVFSQRPGLVRDSVKSVRTFSGIQHVHIWGDSRHVLSSWEGWKPGAFLPFLCGCFPAASAAGMGELHICPRPVLPRIELTRHKSAGYGRPCEIQSSATSASTCTRGHFHGPFMVAAYFKIEIL